MTDSRKEKSFQAEGTVQELLILDSCHALAVAKSGKPLSPSNAGQLLVHLIKGWSTSDRYKLNLENEFLREIELLIIRNPSLKINLKVAGNTALHFAILAKENFNRWLVDLLCANGASLNEENTEGKSPLELGLDHPFFAADIVKHLLSHYPVKESILQKIICKAFAYKEQDLAEWLTVTYPDVIKKINSIQIESEKKGLIHLAVSFPRFDEELITHLLQAGATLQDTNAHKQTVQGYLIKHDNYQRLQKLVENFDDKLTLAQIKNSYAQLRNAGQHDVCGNLLATLAEKKYCPQAIVDIVHEKPVTFSLQTFQRIALSNVHSRPNDFNFLELINYAKGDTASKKSAFCEIIYRQVAALKTPESLLEYVKELDALCQTNKKLEFLRRRYSMSFTGHTWKGQDACYTWVKIIEKVKARILEVTANNDSVENREILGFLKTPTRTRSFGIFEHNDKLAQKYLTLCAKKSLPNGLRV